MNTKTEVPKAPAMSASTGLSAEELSTLRKSLLILLCRHGIDIHVAEDLVQESLARIWRSFPQLRDRGLFAPWARSIALNRLRSHTVRSKTWSEIPVDTASRSPGPLEDCIRREGEELLERLVSSLDPKDRAVVRLRHEDQVDPETVGRLLGLPDGRARRRLHAAMERLRRRAESRLGRCAALAFGFQV